MELAGWVDGWLWCFFLKRGALFSIPHYWKPAAVHNLHWDDSREIRETGGGESCRGGGRIEGRGGGGGERKAAEAAKYGRRS